MATEESQTDEFYEVEKIISKDVTNKKYLVKWYGYDDLTWEDMDSFAIDVPLLVKKFENK